MPAGPTKGLPCRSSWSPGCSPTNISARVLRAFAGHRLRRVLADRALAAALERFAQRRQAARRIAARRLVVARRRLRLGGGAALRVGRSAGDHGQAPFAGRGGQRFDQRRFRQVLPVALGHLLLHRAELQARRVEDAPVVGEPELLAGIGRRCLVAPRARAEPEPLAVPADAALGRQDRPAHGGEAAREERRRRLDDVMLGLEPGDVQRARRRRPRRRGSRKRTKAFILCMSRRTACAISSARSQSAIERIGAQRRARPGGARAAGRAGRSGPGRGAGRRSR